MVPSYDGMEQKMTEPASQADISAMALRMRSQEELDRLSRDQLKPIYSLAEANARKQPPPGLAQLQQQRRVLERSLLHPALRK